MFPPLPPPPAGRVRAPLYRVAELGSGRRHGGDRGGGIMGMGCEAALPPGAARRGAARLYRCLCFGLTTSISAPGKEGPPAARSVLGGVGGAEAMIGTAGEGNARQAGRGTVARSVGPARPTSASPAVEPLKGQRQPAR